MSIEKPILEQVARLEELFKRKIRTSSEEDDSGDDNVFGEQWELEKPEELKEWSIGLVPFTNRLHSCHLFENAPHFFFLSADEKIKDVHHTDGLVNISWETTIEPVYMFTLCIDYKKSKFNVTYFLSTLQNTNYEPLMKSLEEQVDKGLWGTEEKRLSVRAVISKIREVIITLASETTLLQHETRRLAPIDSRVIRLMDAEASQGSAPTSGSRSNLRPRTPATATRTPYSLK